VSCVRHFIAVFKYLSKTTSGRKDVFYLTVSEVSAPQGGEDVAEQNSLYHDGQEAEKENSCIVFSLL
jgi:hypothetical protein